VGVRDGKASYCRHWHSDASSQERMQALGFCFFWAKPKERALPAVRKWLARNETLRTGKIEYAELIFSSMSHMVQFLTN
jgi:hypothetical protein